MPDRSTPPMPKITELTGIKPSPLVVDTSTTHRELIIHPNPDPEPLPFMKAERVHKSEREVLLDNARKTMGRPDPLRGLDIARSVQETVILLTLAEATHG